MNKLRMGKESKEVVIKQKGKKTCSKEGFILFH